MIEAACHQVSHAGFHEGGQMRHLVGIISVGAPVNGIYGQGVDVVLVVLLTGQVQAPRVLKARSTQSPM